jgi:hypothetical protein
MALSKANRTLMNGATGRLRADISTEKRACVDRFTFTCLVSRVTGNLPYQDSTFLRLPVFRPIGRAQEYRPRENDVLVLTPQTPHGDHSWWETSIRNEAINCSPAAITRSPSPEHSAFVFAVIGSMAMNSLSFGAKI